MSHPLIHQYLNHLATLRKISGSSRESVVREAFKDLLKGWARTRDLVLVPEYEIITPAKDRRYVDGALLYSLRVPFGYWEAKDEKDDLDAEIEYKFKRGYPQDNIIFEDSTAAVLIQNKREVMRCAVDDVEKLQKLLELFFAYERSEIAEFRKAVEQFKTDIPAVLDALREMIEVAHTGNPGFTEAEQQFLQHGRDTINPSLTAADVREMLIQHILTEEIFGAVFPGSSFHRENNIARELYKLEDTFFTGNTKYRTLKGLEPYYAAVRSAASFIENHKQKQEFLKIIYENFYKVYNAKAADRLGVVYTPNEIVRFMIESADWLCEKHFKRNLIDRDVEILDFATGTGTYICELLEYFRGQIPKLKYKYAEELHANEVAILPYYVANLNIEATYAAITGEYAEFPNLCFVDTLDNTAALHESKGFTMQMEGLGGFTSENVVRIKRQNTRRISVLIGNPPYNANQLNENENNKNREYPEIDKRIKNTYIKASTAQKTKLYDMYARFFRWASDRLDRNGVLAFITNRSFIDSRTFDGFRKAVADEFAEIYVLDLGGDVRVNPKLSGTKHNVFGIQTGVAISFLVKREKNAGCRIFYARRPEFETAEEKLSFLAGARGERLDWSEIHPDAKHNWINLVQNDFEELMPIASKGTKHSKAAGAERAIFKLFSLGVKTNRDEWVCAFSPEEIKQRVQFLIEGYSANLRRLGKSVDKASVANKISYEIKWTRKLKNLLVKNEVLKFDESAVVPSLYRPYVTLNTYFQWELNEDHYKLDSVLHSKHKNPLILIPGYPSGKPFHCLVTEHLFHHDTLEKTACLPLLRFNADGEASSNITDWAVDQFTTHYQSTEKKSKRPITAESIFHYVYAVLHNPAYREKYALNLKRDFPRIPFYDDFWKWADWGAKLMELHIGFETAKPYALKRVDVPDEKTRKAGKSPKALLKADKDHGRILFDDETTLLGIPPSAWEYKLGNRSALEWILDQYKEKKPKDPTIREKFNTYRFADYKEKVIDLLMRVTTVSVETVAIVEAMRKETH